MLPEKSIAIRDALNFVVFIVLRVIDCNYIYIYENIREFCATERSFPPERRWSFFNG